MKAHYNLQNEGTERQEIVHGMSEILLTLLNNVDAIYLDDEQLADLLIDVHPLRLDTATKPLDADDNCASASGNSAEDYEPFFVPLSRDVIDEKMWEIKHRVATAYILYQR